MERWEDGEQEQNNNYEVLGTLKRMAGRRRHKAKEAPHSMSMANFLVASLEKCHSFPESNDNRGDKSELERPDQVTKEERLIGR